MIPRWGFTKKKTDRRICRHLSYCLLARGLPRPSRLLLTRLRRTRALRFWGARRACRVRPRAGRRAHLIVIRARKTREDVSLRRHEFPRRQVRVRASFRANHRSRTIGSGRAETPPGRLTGRSSPASARLVACEARGATRRPPNRGSRTVPTVSSCPRSGLTAVLPACARRVRYPPRTPSFRHLPPPKIDRASSGGVGTPCSAW